MESKGYWCSVWAWGKPRRILVTPLCVVTASLWNRITLGKARLWWMWMWSIPNSVHVHECFTFFLGACAWMFHFLPWCMSMPAYFLPLPMLPILPDIHPRAPSLISLITLREGCWVWLTKASYETKLKPTCVLCTYRKNVMIGTLRNLHMGHRVWPTLKVLCCNPGPNTLAAASRLYCVTSVQEQLFWLLYRSKALCLLQSPSTLKMANSFFHEYIQNQE